MNYEDNAQRQRSIGVTLRRSAKHPFYREHWGSRADAICSASPDTPANHFFDALRELPPIGQRDFVSHVKPILDPGETIASVRYSSGSTGGPKFRYWSTREARLIDHVGDGVNLAPSELSLMAPVLHAKPVALQFITVWNGNPGIVTESHMLSFIGVLDNDHSLAQIQQLLTQEFLVPGYTKRVQVLSGSVESLKVFTRHLMDQGIPASTSAIRSISAFGMYFGPNSRRWLFDFWKCPIIDNFSISEMPGGGFICQKCGFIDFKPTIAPGVLHLTENRPVSTGEGRLLLTSLLPAAVAQPLINYLPGDIVEWISDGHGCPQHVGGIRRLGRGEYSFVREVDGEPRLLLGSQDLHDALDGPGADRRHPYLRISSITTNDVYTPRCSMTCEARGDGGYLISVAYRPEDTQQQNGADTVLARLSAFKRVAPLVQSGALAVKVVESVDAPVFPWKFA